MRRRSEHLQCNDDDGDESIKTETKVSAQEVARFVPARELELAKSATVFLSVCLRIKGSPVSGYKPTC